MVDVGWLFLNDEILVGKIKSSSSEGILVTLGFFDDILIRPECMPQHTLFNDQEQVWIWNYKIDDQTNPYYMDIGHDIRVRVEKEVFVDTTPSLSKAEAASSIPTNSVPYTILATIAQPGLGILSWW